MSLINRIKKARAKAEKLSEKSKKASGIEVLIENRWVQFAEDSVFITAKVCWGRNHARC